MAVVAIILLDFLVITFSKSKMIKVILYFIYRMFGVTVNSNFIYHIIQRETSISKVNGVK